MPSLSHQIASATGLLLVCSIEGCGRKHVARGWCGAHYQRWKSHGHPLGGGLSRGECTRWILEVAVPYTGDDCLTWPYCTVKGYGHLKWQGKGLRYAHNVVCELVHGPAPDPALEAAHSCGNGHLACVNPKHLRWATRAENAADRVLHGTSNHGAGNGTAKLSEHDVRHIRSLRGKASRAEIAAKYGVCKHTVGHIQTRRTWKHVP